MSVPVWAEPLFGPPLEIAAILLIGVLARHLLHRLIDRIAEGIASGRAGLARLEERGPTSTARIVAAPLISERREQRARTTASVLRSLATAVVTAIVMITVLDVLSIPVAPLLASAGIVGVAAGFGAQSLVKDVISGLFMMVEDQYGVGDVVDLGGASGVVEAVGLRVTRLRGTDGTIWYVRNGEVLRVANHSQGWARALLDVAIAHQHDVARAEQVLRDGAAELRQDAQVGPLMLEEPELWVEQVTADGVVLRLVVKTEPLRQWDVARELRRRVMDRLAAEEIAVAPVTGATAPGPPV
ncbi:MAG: mechanosensitive ion channel family protein [Kineosporiaceae bacterium]